MSRRNVTHKNLQAVGTIVSAARVIHGATDLGIALAASGEDQAVLILAHPRHAPGSVVAPIGTLFPGSAIHFGWTLIRAGVSAWCRRAWATVKAGAK